MGLSGGPTAAVLGSEKQIESYQSFGIEGSRKLAG